LSDAIVLAGHGSRSPEANASLFELACALEAELAVIVLPAFLEMAEPTIPGALQAAKNAGAARVVLMPYFLSPGMHVKRDLTAIADDARSRLGIRIDIADFLGAHPDVPRLVAELSRTALGVV
jgi:sirohydrochlorin ferrochelatase